MKNDKVSKAKTITLEKLQTAFRELGVSDEDAQTYAAKGKDKAGKKALKAKTKFEKLELKVENKDLKHLDKDLHKGIKWAQKHVGM